MVEADRDSVWFVGEKSGEVDVVLVAIVIADYALEVRKGVDMVFLFAPKQRQLICLPVH